MSRLGLYDRAIELKKPLPGWCSDEKARALVDAVLDAQSSNYPPTVVEIGVFGGQSLVTLATALKATKGHVWGIDPWNAGDSTAHADDPDNTAWWSKVKYEDLYRGVLGVLLTQELTPACTLLRMSSRQAARLFDDESIDILHIDGNHAPVSSSFDVVTWVPKVRPEGLVIMDDIDWKQVEMAYDLVRLQCKEEKTIGIEGQRCSFLRRPGLFGG